MALARVLSEHRRFRVLLAALAAFLTLAPLAVAGPYAVALLQLLLSGLLGAILLVLRGRPEKRLSTVFVVGTLVLLWSAGITPSRVQASLTLAALLGLNLVVLVVVVRTVAETRMVSVDTVLGATLGYLLLGLAFAFLYGFFAIALPGSLPVGRVGGGPMPTLLEAGRGFPDLLYFSYTTLSTLGYGDLTPTHPFVRSLSSFEALLGQLYLAVLVARLVGLHLAHEALPSGPPAHAHTNTDTDS